jgi:hypothetical protein
MGWASPGSVAEADFTATGDFAEREKDGFMGNFQYIADCLPLRLFPRSGSGVNFKAIASFRTSNCQ